MFKSVLVLIFKHSPPVVRKFEDFWGYVNKKLNMVEKKVVN